MTLYNGKDVKRRLAQRGQLPDSYADPIAAQRENSKPRIRVKAGSSK